LSRAAQLRWLDGVGDIGAPAWNALAGDYPFLRHEFLHALESTGCASPETGWTPHHLVIEEDGSLIAAAPVYRKSHSWGEFVFDFGWARASEQRGQPYYPKMVVAVPFTPATGPRILVDSSRDPAATQRLVLQALETESRALGDSSVHALFIDAPLQSSARAAGWLLRSDCHFQWHHRGYQSFDDFLATFSADKRKKARRERRRVLEQGIEYLTLDGARISAAQLAHVYRFHASTFMRHGHVPYLTEECLQAIARGLGEAFIVKLAVRAGKPVAAAVFMRSSDTLYGRYWGADDEYHSLHFDACYYQGIELCLELGLQRFEPGTQGEHKLARGFEPVLTWSAHWLADRSLRQALAHHLRREQAAVEGYAASAAEHLPFREADAPIIGAE
jgi:predicted N-acyltransferase